MGRRPLGDRAMTPAERQRRHRKTLKMTTLSRQSLINHLEAAAASYSAAAIRNVDKNTTVALGFLEQARGVNDLVKLLNANDEIKLID